MHTDGDFQSIVALEIIIVCRLDSKTPPGTLGCQHQRGAAAKVTGFSHTHNLAAHSKAVLHRHMPHLWPKLACFMGHRRSQGRAVGSGSCNSPACPALESQSHSPYFSSLQGTSFIVQIKVPFQMVISFLIIPKTVFHITRLGC